MRSLAAASLVLIALLVSTSTASTESRFTRSIAPTQSSEAGIDTLDSDQAAVLDALIRREIESSAKNPSKKNTTSSFSERLSADERRNSGIDNLSATQRLRLDGLVQHFINPAPALGSASSNLASGSSVEVLTAKSLRRAPEIHGSFTLLYGVGSGGYSERGGGMTLSYEDPARGFAVAVGYSEIHTKGGGGYYYHPYRYGRGFRSIHDPRW